MRLLLVNPPYNRFINYIWPTFPLGLGYIASALIKEGHTVEIFDAEWEPYGLSTQQVKYPLTFKAKNAHRFSDALQNHEHEVWKRFEFVIKHHTPQVVGITCRSLDLLSAQMFSRIVKRSSNEIVVVLGGPGATTCTEISLEEDSIDYVVRGEGEVTMSKLVKELERSTPNLRSIDGLSYRKSGRIIHNKSRHIIEDISRLQYPARDSLLYADTVPKNIYKSAMGGLITSRGCPFNCSFCAAHNVWESNKSRMRTAQDVVEEVLFLRDKYDLKFIIFWDDLFTISKKRTVKICSLLLEKNANVNWLCQIRADTIDNELVKLMKKAGCTNMNMGVESGSDRILEKMQKGITVDQIKKAGEILNKNEIAWHAFLMIGIPGETKADMKASMRLIREIKPTAFQLSIFAPYPGTKLYEDLKPTGVLDNVNLLFADMLNVDCCYTGNMSQENFHKIALRYLKQCDRYNLN